MNPYHNHVYGFIPSFPIKGHPEIESPESKQQKVLRNATSSAFRLFVLWRLGSSIGFGEAPCHGDVGTCLWRPWGFPGYVPEIGIVKVRDGWTMESWEEDDMLSIVFWMHHLMMMMMMIIIIIITFTVALFWWWWWWWFRYSIIILLMVMMKCMFIDLVLCFSFLFIPECWALTSYGGRVQHLARFEIR